MPNFGRSMNCNQLERFSGSCRTHIEWDVGACQSTCCNNVRCCCLNKLLWAVFNTFLLKLCSNFAVRPQQYMEWLSPVNLGRSHHLFYAVFARCNLGSFFALGGAVLLKYATTNNRQFKKKLWRYLCVYIPSIYEMFCLSIKFYQYQILFQLANKVVICNMYE